MDKSNIPNFTYPHWGRALGLIIIAMGIAIFTYRIIEFGIVDLHGASFPFAMGLMIIFFSRQRDFDERIAYLKFKSLAASIPLAAIIAMLINYSQNFVEYSIETDSWFSISAFQYLSIVMILALGWFHYLKIKE
ncbi:MAG: hypothetical protein RIC35_20620 [Marinoscillum sp.]